MIRPKHKTTAYIASFLVIMALIASTTVILKSPDQQKAQHTETVTYTVENPSENKVSGYKVPATQPLSIKIAATDIQGFIQKVGVDQNKDITAPNNVHLAGWFTGSVLPGRAGLSIIDGHVDGRTQQGIFHNLKQVKVGDTVVITFGDQSTKTFSVFATRSLAANDSASSLFNQDPNVMSQLNIITCTGKYDTTGKEYTQRLIVSAKLVES